MPESTVPASSNPKAAVELSGIGGSAGFAMGRAVVIDTRRPGIPQRRVSKALVDEELGRFDTAVEHTARSLREVADSARSKMARAESSILEAYVLMVQDETLRDDVERHIRIDHQCAEWALDNAIRQMTRQLQAADNPYLAERVHDLEFVRDRILRTLSGKQRSLSLPDATEARIIVARDLSPAETAGLSRKQVAALVTEVGTRTSHTAILARALEIPAVVGVRHLLANTATGDELIVDGLHGKVIVSPTERVREETHTRAHRYYTMARGLRELRDRPATSKCGVPIEIKANIELPAEAEIAMDHGAQGIGLYRTEFLYINRTEPPSEDEQYEIYRQVVEATAPLPVTLRTFDIGGDKFSTVFQVPAEMNPALGLRAVRLGLEQPEIFRVQLRAMIRASAHGKVQIMIPMVASLREFREVKTLFETALAEVDAASHARAERIPLGVMIEVPSAAILADQFAQEAEFMSIGTNDLVQYALAVDRASHQLARLASFFDPAILRLIQGVIDAGTRCQRPVIVCGAMASDPIAALLLVGMGLRRLSLEASAISEVKATLARFTLAEAQELAKAAFFASTADDVEQVVAAQCAPRIADLLDPGIEPAEAVTEAGS